MKNIEWIKIKTDIFNNEKIKLIEDLPEGDTIIVIWVKLLCLAGQINDGGLIYITKKIPFNEETLSKIMNRKIDVVRLALQTFIKFDMIEIERDIIIILNWDKHQSLDKLEKIQEKNRNRVAEFRKKQKLRINNNIEVDKEVEVEEIITVTLQYQIKEIIDYLNFKCNKKFSYNNKSFNKHIEARLKEGFIVNDFKKIIDIKIQDKFFMENPKYFNPETLFRPSNFEKYLNENTANKLSNNNDLPIVSRDYLNNFNLDE